MSNSSDESGRAATAAGQVPTGEAADDSGIVLRAKGLRKSFGRADTAVDALDDISVDFESGRFTAIMGPSGSGKSTFMHVLAGLDRVDSGAIIMRGEDITRLNDRQLTPLRRDRVGFIFHAFNLAPAPPARSPWSSRPTSAGGTRSWSERPPRCCATSARTRPAPGWASPPSGPPATPPGPWQPRWATWTATV